MPSVLKGDLKIRRVQLDFPMDQVVDSVLKLRNLWESRSLDFPFFTLGKSAYLDGNTEEYFKGARKLNPVLMKTFHPLYKRVANVLGNDLGERTFFKFNVALPGFHIFPSDEKLLSVSGNWHIDNPHVALELGQVDTSAFTVPVMLPISGGGMDSEDGYHPYTVGEMIMHDGKQLHRIASYKKYKQGEYRITLQGHIVRNDRGNLIMFW